MAPIINALVRLLILFVFISILHHSEDWPAEAVSELDRLRAELDCTDADALVVVWGAEDDTLTAAEEIRLRYVDAADGIPNETRQPFEDGSTDFERILPGPDRMYPDTDSPPTALTTERVERLLRDAPAGGGMRMQYAGFAVLWMAVIVLFFTA